MKHAKMAALILISLCAVLFALYALYKPSNSDYLTATINHYLKASAESGLIGRASASDCRIIDADEDEQSNGVAKFGLCSVIKADGHTTYYYQVALSYTANVEYFHAEERSK